MANIEAPSTPPEPEHRYEQELSRTIHVLGNLMITLSSITPASSVFIIIPLILVTAGTGSFVVLAFAALVGVFMAFCWGELSAAFPIAGGDYAITWHAFKGRLKRLATPVSVVLFALWIDTIVFIPAVIALGTAQYLGVVWNVDTEVAGAVVMLLAAGIAILRIRVNAWVTGICLAIELLALAALTVIGFANFHNRFPELFGDWVIGNADGGLDPVAFGTILTATAVGVFAYNGYAAPVNLSEETRGSSRGIARAILLALGITVAAELIPTTAVLFGTPDLAATTTSSSPMNDFLLATTNDTVNTLISLGVALAILNAVIAIVIQFSRVLYGSGRDNVWPGPVNRWMSTVSPKTHTPWLATAVVGISGAVLCLTVSLSDLITLTGATLVLNYGIVAIAALVGRATGATKHSPYKMPWWPLPPLLAIAALAYITTKQTDTSLKVTGITMLIGLVYWAVVVWPQKGRAWNIKDPVFDSDEA